MYFSDGTFSIHRSSIHSIFSEIHLEQSLRTVLLTLQNLSQK